jgi:hypothetical protein
LVDAYCLILEQIVCELPAGTNWNFDVHWYPKMPGVISASSFDGKVGIYNIEVSIYFVLLLILFFHLAGEYVTSKGREKCTHDKIMSPLEKEKGKNKKKQYHIGVSGSKLYSDGLEE